MEKYRQLFKSFGYAFRGIADCILNERNMRIHLVCVIYMYGFLGLSDWFVLSSTQWAVIFLANALVFMGELINTAVENVVDLVTKEESDLARRAKDAAAGAVLVAAVFAVLTGVSVLWQPEAFRQLFTYFKTHLPVLAAFAVSIGVATLFIFFGIPGGKRGSQGKVNSEK